DTKKAANSDLSYGIILGLNDCYSRYFIRTPYNGVLASQTRHDYCPQSSMIRGVMSPGLVGRW
ncbi:hypothetical protein U0Z36_005108, partial [Escherichia coli]|nr:hypothetical protein [Escherichia coli]